MNVQFKQLLTFSRRQQRGIAILLVLLLIIVTTSWWWPSTQFEINNNKESEELFRNEAKEFLKTKKIELKKQVDLSKFSTSENFHMKEKVTLFNFNPNTLDESGWEKLGLNNGQVRSIKNYQLKGGKFYKKEDVAKLYCLGPEDYKRLEPYITIPPPNRKTIDSANSITKKLDNYKTSIPIEINIADSAKLTTLRGIGPVFASRIIRYRDKLGGFVKKDQLLDVFGMDTSRLHQIDTMILIDTSLIRKININTATFKELLRHPYLDFYMVKIICREREKRKVFKSVNDLRSLDQMYEELFQKMKPYLSTTSKEEK